MDDATMCEGSSEDLVARYAELLAANLPLPPRKRLEIMEIAIRAAREIREGIGMGCEEHKEDAAIAVAGILSVIDALNRRCETP